MTIDKTELAGLERLFHEPSRLSIMSVLCGAERAMSFTALRNECGLTDGNLNRHLKVLTEAKVVGITKRFVKEKPLTTVVVTPGGLSRFAEYLQTLEQVLSGARKALRSQEQDGAAFSAAPARA